MTFVRYYGLEAAEGRAGDLAEALRILADRVRACSGCEKVEILKDATNPDNFVLMEFWDSPESHKAAGAALGKEAFAPVMAALQGRPQSRDYHTLGAPAGGPR